MKCRAVDGRGKCTHEGGKRLENQVDIVESGSISSSAQCPKVSLQMTSVSFHQCTVWPNVEAGEMAAVVNVNRGRV